METTFRYRRPGPFMFVVWTCAVDLLPVWFVVVGVQSGDRSPVWLGLVLLLFFSLIGWAVVSSLADVVVSDTGLSRRLRGHKLREISWGI